MVLTIPLYTLLIFLCLLTLPINSYAEERILSLISDITIDRNGFLTIQETITVRAEGKEIKRGIYRDFITRHGNSLGNTKIIHFQIYDVLRDGKPEAYHTEDTEGGIRLYIGHRDVFLKPGTYKYSITYGVDREVRHFPEHDEIYWNVTGNRWAFPIDYAKAIINLPAGAEKQIKILQAFTGPQGAKGKDFVLSKGYNGQPIFESSGILNPGEGLTIVVGWAKGFVAEPTKEQEFHYFVRDNRGVLIAGLGLFIVSLYYLLIWLRVGKDPEKGVIFPIYEPPPRYSPASIRYISNMDYDNKVFAAAILSLAVKGHIRIQQEDKGKYTLVKLKGDNASLKEDERSLLDKLFKTGDSITLDRSNRTTIKEASDALKKRLASAYERIYFFTNKGYFLAGVAISLIAAACGTFFGNNPPFAMFISLWLTIWSIGVSALLISIFSAWRRVLRERTTKITSLLSAIFISLFAVPFIGAEIFALFLLAKSASVIFVLLLVALGAVNYIFYHLLKAPTLMGRKLLDQIEGFKLFLGTTEKHRMDMQYQPNRTIEVFERYLPFAVALDLENQWAERFADIINKSVIEETARSHASWYSGDIRSDSSLGDIASSIGEALSSSLASSSGSAGSGGSSGGGGGGGGGGGW